MAHLIGQDVLGVLEQCRIEDNKVFLPDVKLNRPLYLGVNKVLAALGGAWNRKAKAHIFPDDPTDALDGAMLTRTFTVLKQDLQYYPTPNPIIDQMLGEFEEGMRVIEPSAGEGAIVQKLLGIGCSVNACEQHPPFRETLNKRFREHDDFTLFTETDFLKLDPQILEIEAIIANPPFTRPQDVDHVSHMIDFLDKGGLLVSVMSSGVTFRQTKKTLALLAKLHEQTAHYFHKLPEGSFKSAGTNVNTVLLTARKK